MPQIAQQDYKVIAPKEGRSFGVDAAALGELKKSVLSGVAFDCLLKDQLTREGTLDRVLGIYEDGSMVDAYNTGNEGYVKITIPYTVEQYEGLSAVQNALDAIEIQDAIPSLTKGMDDIHLSDDNTSNFICVDGKYLTVTASSNSKIEALEIAENGPSDDAFVNITWEDAQKLIGLPLV